MNVQLPKSVYTQINTDSAIYLIQNLSSSYSVGIIASDTQPAANAAPDYIIEPYNGIGNKHVESLIWGKPIGKVQITVGLTEG